MWRFIFIAAIFISAFLPSSGADRLVCRDGFTLKGRSCENKVPSYLYCQLPSTDWVDSCVIYRQYCSSTDLGDAIPQSARVWRGCPEGYTEDPDYNLQSCFRKVNLGAPVMRCEPGCYESNGKCMYDSPESFVYCPTRPHCETGEPEGEIENDKLVYKCIRKERKPLGYYCPQGSGEVRFRCRFGTPGPTGCENITVFDPEPLCPSGFHFVDGKENCQIAFDAVVLPDTTTPTRPTTDGHTAEGATRRMLKGLPSEVL